MTHYGYRDNVNQWYQTPKNNIFKKPFKNNFKNGTKIGTIQKEIRDNTTGPQQQQQYRDNRGGPYHYEQYRDYRTAPQ